MFRRADGTSLPNAARFKLEPAIIVSEGAFGQIIINDSHDGVPPNVAAIAERQAVVAYLDPTVAGTGGDTLMSGSLSPSWTIKGLVGGSLCAPANEWQHWRVLVVDADATDNTIGVGPAARSRCSPALACGAPRRDHRRFEVLDSTPT